MKTNDNVIGANGAPLPRPKWFQMELRFDSLLMLISMLGAMATAVFEGGEIRASLEAGLHAETDARAAAMATVQMQLAGVQGDVREIRTYMMQGHRP